MAKATLERAGFGGGCHWCTEAVFQSLRGVSKVEQGFIASDPPNESLSEAVIVHFDRAEISLETLISIHVRTHAATSAHTMRGKYRSAVYVFSKDQAHHAQAALHLEADDFDRPLITQVLPFRDFKPSDPRFHNYYATRPERPFCTTYIDPKLAKIRREFAAHAAP